MSCVFRMLSASLRHCCAWGAFPQVLESPVGSMLLPASPNPSPATNLMLTVMCGGTHPPCMRHSKKHHKPRHGLKPFMLWPWLSPKIHAWHARVTTLFFFLVFGVYGAIKPTSNPPISHPLWLHCLAGGGLYTV